MIKPEQPIFYRKVKAFEAEFIRDALLRTRGNQAQAARILGLSPTTLSSQLRRLGIRVRDFKNQEPLTSFATFQKFLLWKSCGAPHTDCNE